MLCHVPLLSRLGLGGSALLFCSATAGGGLGRSHGVSGATTAPFASLTSVCESAASNDETLYVIWGHPAASSAASAVAAVSKAAAAASSKASEGAAVAEDAAAASGAAAAEGATTHTPTRGHRKSRCRR